VLKNRVEVRLKNKTGQNLTIEEVHVSCGCIVVGELKKHLGMDEEVTVPINLRSKLRSGRFENSITLVDSEKREWQLVLASKVIAPIISDTLQFELPLPGEPGELRKDSVVSCYCTYTDVCDYDCVIDPIGGTKRCKSMNRTDTAITKLITVVGTCVGGIEEP